MEINRGDVVICAAPGDYGKPRPAVVVQSDLFNGTHSSVVVCLITSHLEDAPLFRIPVSAGKTTGLKLQSQVMVDKVIAIIAGTVRIPQKVPSTYGRTVSTETSLTNVWRYTKLYLAAGLLG